MTPRQIGLEPRHVSWLNQLEGDLELLEVSTENGFRLVTLTRPSPELARQAVFEAIIRYAHEWGGTQYAPRLMISVTPRQR